MFWRAPVFGDEAQAGPDGGLRAVGLERLAVEQHRAAGARTQAEDGLDGFGPARADEAAEAQDLARDAP